MGPKDSFNGALTWLLHYGDKQPLTDFIRKNGLQPGIQADTVAQLIEDASFRLGHTTTYEADVELHELMSLLRRMEVLNTGAATKLTIEQSNASDHKGPKDSGGSLKRGRGNGRMRQNSEIEADIRKRLRESGVRVPTGWIKEYMAQFEPRTKAGVIHLFLAEKPRLRKGGQAYRAEFERLKKRLSRIK